MVKLQVNSGELRVTGGSTGGSSQSVHSIFPFQEGARALEVVKTKESPDVKSRDEDEGKVRSHVRSHEYRVECHILLSRSEQTTYRPHHDHLMITY